MRKRTGLSEAVELLGHPVAYYPRIALWLHGDVNAAVFVSQFMYWRTKVGRREVYKTREEIETETGLGTHAQERVCRMFRTEGLLEITRKGMPARNYYRWDWGAVDASFEEWCIKNIQDVTSASTGESPELDLANREN